MRRREFMTIVSGAAVFAPLRGFGQETGRTYRIGVLLGANPRRRSIVIFLMSCAASASSKGKI
jgi:hypothetical protein